MSLITDLLGAGAKFVGDKAKTDATLAAARLGAQADRDELDFKKQVVTGGSQDPQGNITDRLNTETGMFESQLAGASKEAQDAQVGTLAGSAGAKQALTGTTGPLVEDFRRFAAAGGDPEFSLQDAQAQGVRDRANLFKSVIDPTTDKLTRAAMQRDQGTNQLALLPDQLAQLLAGLNLSNDQDARDAKFLADQRFREMTLGSLSSALQTADSGAQFQLPQPATLGQRSAAVSSLPAPPPVPVDLSGTTLPGGVLDLANVFSTRDATAAAAEDKKEQLALVERILAQAKQGNVMNPYVGGAIPIGQHPLLDAIGGSVS
jgi:hypothetical protein